MCQCTELLMFSFIKHKPPTCQVLGKMLCYRDESDMAPVCMCLLSSGQRQRSKQNCAKEQYRIYDGTTYRLQWVLRWRKETVIHWEVGKGFPEEMVAKLSVSMSVKEKEQKEGKGRHSLLFS